ncbi:MAG: hypothetical protein IJC32_04475, partial [Clostridia bacterium]|nr:hypothetical protein [Clostridia bacterium]
LLSQKKKQEKPDGKRKKKKGFPRRPQIRQYRICWFEEVGYTLSVRYKKQCCSDIVFCQISLGGPGPFSKGLGANSAGPNHSLRIRWFEQMVGGGRSLQILFFVPKNDVVQTSFSLWCYCVIQSLFLNLHQKQWCSAIVFPSLVWGVQAPF